ncbi:HTH_Tnp_Tc3_2 domain-containing protein [Trichonephila clavipes]|nr:HTH_Tnp_Tc3_2 domain-containing protein [Trichonephila clavipes]
MRFGIAAPIMCAALDAHPSTPPFGVVSCTRKLDCSGMEPGRFYIATNPISAVMTIVFVCGDPVVTPQSCLCFTETHPSHSWWDDMGCHCLQYTVSPSIVPWHHDSPAVCPRHPATTCVATHATAPKSHFSTRQCSASQGKGVPRLSPHCYNPSLAFPIQVFPLSTNYESTVSRTGNRQHKERIVACRNRGGSERPFFQGGCVQSAITQALLDIFG